MKKIGYALLSAGLTLAGSFSSISAQQDKTKSDQPVTFGGKCQNEQFKYYDVSQAKNTDAKAPQAKGAPVEELTPSKALNIPQARERLQRAIQTLNKLYQDASLSQEAKNDIRKARSNAVSALNQIDLFLAAQANTQKD